MTRTTALKVTVQITYTDHADRIQDLLNYVHFLETNKKTPATHQEGKDKPTRNLQPPLPGFAGDPF